MGDDPLGCDADRIGDDQLPADGSDSYYISTIDLGARAPVALTDADVNVPAAPSLFTPDGDPSCGGSAAAPTAPPGKVCLDPAPNNAYANLEDIDGAAQAVGGDHSFQVRWHSYLSDNLMRWSFTWAYAAP